MRVRTTSTQRTYRYVRLSLVGSSLLLTVSLVLEIAGHGVLPSLSASYYTASGPVFVGTLFAVAVALLVLSGRSLEQGLLDVAAVLALMIAVVPTTVTGASCPGSASCVPAEVVPQVVNNGVAVASVVLVGAVAAVVLARVQGTAGAGVMLTAGAVVVVVVAAATTAVVASDAFLRWAHTVAAVAFFVIIAVVAAVAAWRPQARGRRGRVVRIAYGMVGGGIAVTLGALGISLAIGAARGSGTGFPAVFVAEAVALLLFLVFWVVQTVELWNDVDPAIRGRPSPTSSGNIP